MPEYAMLTWDDVGERFYETGTDRGVLYPYQNGAPAAGIAWNGLSGVDISPDGGEVTDVYANNGKYLSLRSVENCKGTINAYQSPAEFDECDGSVRPSGTVGLRFGQQTRKPFGFAFRTRVGNDQQFEDYGYKLHLLYGCTASPSERSYQTINESPEATELSWEFDTIPVAVEGYKPLAHIEIDSTLLTTAAEKACLTALETILYGSSTAAARLPLPAEVITIMTPAAPQSPEGT